MKKKLMHLIIFQNETNGIKPSATTVNGYLDFESKVDGNDVEAHWKVTITTPNTKITNVNLTVLWGSGGIETNELFKYSTYGVPTHVANVAYNSYFITGKHQATIVGDVETTKRVAYTVTSGTITFYTK